MNVERKSHVEIRKIYFLHGYHLSMERFTTSNQGGGYSFGITGRFT